MLFVFYLVLKGKEEEIYIHTAFYNEQSIQKHPTKKGTDYKFNLYAIK